MRQRRCAPILLLLLCFDFAHNMRCRIYFKTSLPVEQPDAVEKFIFMGVPFLTSVKDRPFIEKTTAEDPDASFFM